MCRHNGNAEVPLLNKASRNGEKSLGIAREQLRRESLISAWRHQELRGKLVRAGLSPSELWGETLVLAVWHPSTPKEGELLISLSRIRSASHVPFQVNAFLCCG
jgi:hypothetical protein